MNRLKSLSSRKPLLDRTMLTEYKGHGKIQEVLRGLADKIDELLSDDNIEDYNTQYLIRVVVTEVTDS